ncbi:hypothetical protein KSP40_PGU013435 [Platanthera guangdongensis]|uniref:25S rRNA (uridine-N(3))-methyltransferase BMT5-like domain-containing protein n=1 Tax=Platanthera guangdongensis TaxID=2320717 RepID=A0ABR2LBX0_9ASPA
MGATIIHEVDARQMRVHPILRRRKFDRIVYNFPHAGFKGPEDSIKMINQHRVWLCPRLDFQDDEFIPDRDQDDEFIPDRDQFLTLM